MAAETTPPIRPTGPTDSPQDGPEDDCPKLSPWLFVVENVYLAALLAIGAWYVWPDSSLAATLPHSLGFIPVAIPWWGGLGAVMISLYGMYLHTGRNIPPRRGLGPDGRPEGCWDPGYDFWHATKILSGPAIGVVAYLIFIVVIKSADPKSTTEASPTYYLVAFLAAYAEASFRSLVQRAINSLLSGDTATKNAATVDTHIHKIRQVHQLEQTGALTAEQAKAKKEELLKRL